MRSPSFEFGPEVRETLPNSLARRVFLASTEKLLPAGSPGSKTEEVLRDSIAKLQPLIEHFRTDPDKRPGFTDYLSRQPVNFNLAEAAMNRSIAEACSAIRKSVRASLQSNLGFEAIFGDIDAGKELKNKSAKSFRKVGKLEKNIQGMVDTGEVDESLAMLFLSQYLRVSYRTFRPIYQTLIQSEEPFEKDEYAKKNARFQRKLRELKKGKPKGKVEFDKRKDTYFFNTDSKSQNTSYRVYIAPSMNADPAKVIKLLQEALDATGTSAHYKTFADLGLRNDQITVYLGEEQVDGFEKAFDHFWDNCPPNHLTRTNIPTGIPLGAGVTFGVEPAQLNDIADDGICLNKFSYNELIAQAMTMAYGFAYNDMYATNRKTDYSIRDLESVAEPYFEQVLRLAGMNPETMMFRNVRQGRIPAWVKRRMK